MQLIKIILIVLFLNGCGVVNFGGNGKNFVSGKILTIKNTSSTMFQAITSAYALQCNSDYFVRLYKIQENGQVAHSPIASQKSSENQYYFNLDELGIAQTEEVSYLVEVEGCDQKFFRPLTDFGEGQDITYSSTIVGYLAMDEMSSGLQVAKRSEVDRLIKSFDGNDFITAYKNLEDDNKAKDLFQSIFVSKPEIILEAKPILTFTEIPSLISENITSQYRIGAYHLDPNYEFYYEWRLDNKKMSDLSSWNFTPNANQSGKYNITLFVGKKNQSGGLDTAAPYHVINQILIIANTIPATPISFHSDKNLTNDRQIKLRLETGFALSNCRSFSSIAVTENTETQPLANDFIYECNPLDAPLQEVTYLLSSGDGEKNLRLWVMDNEGKISSSYTTSKVVLDQSAPSVEIAQLPSLIKGGSSRTLSFTINDPSLATSNLYYSNDGISFSLIGEVSNNNFNFTFPKIDTLTAQFKIIATDLLGQSTEKTSNQFTIETTPPPAPNALISSPIITNSLLQKISITNCSSFEKILISESSSIPDESDVRWIGCTNLIDYNLSSGENGNRHIHIFSKSLAGNISSSTKLTVTLDTVPPLSPTLAFNSNNLTSLLAKETTIGLKVFTCEVQSKLLITESLEKPDSSDPNWFACSTTPGSFSYSLFNKTEGNHTLMAWSQDIAGNVSASPATLNFTLDLTPPIMNYLSINDGQLETGNNNVVVTLKAQSTLAKITDFCIKQNISEPPAESDACWTSLQSIGFSPSNSFDLDEYPYQLGTILGEYEVSVWLKDEAKNIGHVYKSINVDTYKINFTPDPSPVILNVIATNNLIHSSPLSTADTVVPSGGDVYIKWKVIDNAPIPAGNIKLYRTTDELNSTLIVSGLSDGVNGDCSIEGDYTGCYKWSGGSPNSFYKIKIEVQDSGVSVATSVSNNLNTGKVNFLSGNTSLGLGSSATSAILRGINEDKYNDGQDHGSFVVTKKGHIFFKYGDLGLSHISPEDGLINILIKQTGLYGPDNVPVGSATINSLKLLALDHEENLILVDGLRIRKIYLNETPWRIQTIAGGGASTADQEIALNASLPTLNNRTLFTPTPDGRIYFQNKKDIWYYDSKDKKVKLFTKTFGLGATISNIFSPGFDHGFCDNSDRAIAFNKATGTVTKIIGKSVLAKDVRCGGSNSTSVPPNAAGNFNVQTGEAEFPHPPTSNLEWTSTPVTGKDGKIYVLQHGRTGIFKYIESENRFEKILGSTLNGRCEDGTPALSCPVIAMSVYVNEFGKVYFLDMGVIRTIDQEGNVRTIAGQPRNFGIGENPISARYSQLNYFDLAGDNVYISNRLENKIIRFSLAPDQKVQHITGDGTKLPYSSLNISTGKIATESPLPDCGWQMPCGFKVNDDQTRLYHFGSQPGKITYVDLTTGKWVVTNLVTQDTSSRLLYLATHESKQLVYSSNDNEGKFRGSLHVFNDLSNTVTKVYGVEEPNPDKGTYIDICDQKDSLTCPLNSTTGVGVHTSFKFDEFTNNWLITYRERKYIQNLPESGGLVTNFTTTLNPIIAFDYFRNEDNKLVFYCSSGGLLYQKDLNTSLEKKLDFPTTTMKCTGNSLRYHKERNSVIFLYEQNGLFGVAEYNL